MFLGNEKPATRFQETLDADILSDINVEYKCQILMAGVGIARSKDNFKKNACFFTGSTIYVKKNRASLKTILKYKKIKK